MITGFRVAFGGAQTLYGVLPDLTCLGKIIGGGLPIGAYGGRRELMEQVAPAGPVYQAGTLSGNPVAVAAGLKTLQILKEENPYPALEAKGALLAQGLAEAAQEAGVPVQIHQVGSLLGLFFSEAPVRNAADVAASDGEAFRRFFHAMLAGGVYLAPSPWEAWSLDGPRGGRHRADGGGGPPGLPPGGRGFEAGLTGTGRCRRCSTSPERGLWAGMWTSWRWAEGDLHPAGGGAGCLPVHGADQ